MSLLTRLKKRPEPVKDVGIMIGLTRGDGEDTDTINRETETTDVVGQLDIPINDISTQFDRSKLLATLKKLNREQQPAEINVDEEPIVVPEEVEKPVIAIKPKKLVGRKVKLQILDKSDDTKSSPEIIVKKRTRVVRKKGVFSGPVSLLNIGEVSIDNRVAAPQPNIKLRASSYFMNNRQMFTSFISSLLGPYKVELESQKDSVTCDASASVSKGLFIQQEVVRDYLNMYTPYRGLLLYHGLGSGKTCGSIAIAEGMKQSKQVIVMTPASLQKNYRSDLKKCGDPIYRKNQFWEFIRVSNPDSELVSTLSNVLGLPMEWIRKNKGAWMVNVQKPSNFDTLDARAKALLDDQLDNMINHKYRFINYNGIRSSHLSAMSKNYTINPFDNAVIIVDEAHNFVSRIVNKISKKDSLAFRMYQMICSANNSRVVLLSGTPIINYPNEIAILFNLLRGQIKMWSFKLTINSDRKVDETFFRDLFKKFDLMDYVEYRPTSTTLDVTRNPFGFISQRVRGFYKGVAANQDGDVSDEAFVGIISAMLAKNEIKIIPSGTRIQSYNALPETLEEFGNMFIDPKTGHLKNSALFKRRIVGLTSYYRSAQESLMPTFEKSKHFHVVDIEMSDFQFGVYEEARIQERKLEKRNAKSRKLRKGGKTDELYKETVSTYRIFSRAFCNFVFPRPNIVRPMPQDGKDIESILETTADEDLLDAATVEERIENIDGRFTAEDKDDLSEAIDVSYEKRITAALAELKSNSNEYLSPEALETYSPKFLAMLDNINDPENKGLHLIYSQFRTLEGIGIFALVLEENGYARFNISKDTAGSWRLDIADEDRGKPMFALYTGTETAEEKEIIRNIFNGTWELIPTNLAQELSKISSNNLYGEIIRVLMITASGAEGINLQNVRFVHLTEPYWHPVRLEQVIGRARRVCSHKNLPQELQTVEAFLYLMKFSERQLTSDESIELRLQDKSKIDNVTPITTDQALYEIASIKEEINRQILTAVKESAFDCPLYNGKGGDENLKCFTFGKAAATKFSYTPSITSEENDRVAMANKRQIKVKAVSVTIQGIKYAYNKANGDVYDFDSYERGDPIVVGNLKIEGKKYNFTKI